MSDTPRCPHCGSKDTSTSVDYKIKKGLGYAAEFGIGFLAGRFLGDAGADLVEDVSIADGVGKEWQCNKCGYVWRGTVNSPHPNQAQLGTAKPQHTSKSQKQQQYTASNTQHKTYNKQDRAELLKILYKCDGRGGGWNDENSSIQNSEHLYSEMQKYSINISKSKVNSVNSYRRLADIILDSGWTRSKQLETNKPKENAASTSEPQEKKYNKQDRDALLKIIYMCDGRNGDWNDEYSFIQDVERLHSELQKSSISISKSKVYSVNSYKRLADIILDNGWTCAKDVSSRDSQNITVQITEQKNSLQDNVSTDSSIDNNNENEYLEELKACLADGEIGNSERRLLNKLRMKLGISEERAEELEASLQKPQLTEEEQEYLEAFQDAMEDGIISEKERRLLDKLMKMNNISEERAKEIEMFNK